MIVMKFGGTSAEDANAVRHVSSIVKSYREQSPVVVASACAGVTNELIALARAALQGEGVRNPTGVLSRVFSTLEGYSIPISMVSLGASEINVTFVVDEVHVDKVARILQGDFFPRS